MSKDNASEQNKHGSNYADDDPFVHRAWGDVVCVREADEPFNALDEVVCLIYFDGRDEDNTTVTITTRGAMFQVRDKIEICIKKAKDE